MDVIREVYYRSQHLRLITEYQLQAQKNADLRVSMEVLKTALEKIADLTTGESSRIACEVLDSIYPITGATK